MQVECLKELVDTINQLHAEFAGTPLAKNFRRPTIHAMVLFISERTSIKRQLHRGEQVLEHNKEVESTGIGTKIGLRATDLDEEKARRRYQVFKELTWDALQSLKEIYHYHFVNAEGPIREVEQNILDELKYQSSLELEFKTYDRLRPLELAEDITVHARQELVKRLDEYELENTELFIRVVEKIRKKFMPIIKRHAISGKAIVSSEDSLFDEPQALSMLIDIFSERGYHAVVDKRIQTIPERVNLETGEIQLLKKSVFRVQISFVGSEIRRGIGQSRVEFRKAQKIYSDAFMRRSTTPRFNFNVRILELDDPALNHGDPIWQLIPGV